MSNLDGKVAIVTGGTSGIGYAVAKRLMVEGARVVILSERPQSEIDAACDRLRDASHEVVGYVCDVRSRVQAQTVVQQVCDRFGSVDILINNAGAYILDNVCSEDEQAFTQLFDINVDGVYNMIRAVLPAMKAQQRGSIVNMSSAAAARGVSGAACYAASKAAVVMLTQTLPQELKGMGIRINAIGPGAVRTDMTARVHTPQSEEMRQTKLAIANMVPSPDPTGEFVLEPEHIANVAFWLCSDQSWGVNGTCILVDHGLSGSQARPVLPPSGNPE